MVNKCEFHDEHYQCIDRVDCLINSIELSFITLYFIGSMVPFALRLVHAELPQHLGKTQESLDRLYYLNAIVTKVQIFSDS